MIIDLLKKLAVFVILCLAQALVCNHIHLLDCATPYIYIYMIMLFPLNYPKWAVMVWCFMLGMVADTFSNTPGVAAAALTLIGAIHPYWLRLFAKQDSPEDIEGSYTDLGVGKYFLYLFVIVLLYCTIFVSLETFTFFDWQQWLMNVIGSTILTFVVIIAIASLNKR